MLHIKTFLNTFINCYQNESRKEDDQTESKKYHYDIETELTPHIEKYSTSFNQKVDQIQNS